MDAKLSKMLAAMICAPAALGVSQGVSQAAVLADPAVAAGARQDAGTWTFHHEHVLGTSLQVTVRAASRASAEKAEAAALAAFDRDDAVLSAWRADSEFSKWSATRFTPQPVSAELFDVLAGFDHWRERTEGALDASAEAAVRLWREATAEGRLPDAAAIARTLEAMAQPHWSLDWSAAAGKRTATRLTDVPLALASFAKSFVTARAADEALRAGATGVTLNVGGDVVVRGDMTQVVAIADPATAAENGVALDHVVVRDRAVATSGSYRRGFDLKANAAQLAPEFSHIRAPEFSHIMDPRSATPAAHVASSTVIARDAATAGALATAFSVMTVAESERLAAETPGVDYLIVTPDGTQVRSAGWSKYRMGRMETVAYAPPAGKPAPAAGMWDTHFELSVALELPRSTDARYRRPYVAVWVEDEDHFPVRTLALWTQNPRWLPDLKQWYHDDQMRNLAEGTDVSKTISGATRPPGKYTLTWDGKDNEGKPVKAGKYTVCVEASREHGSYEMERQEMDFNGKPGQVSAAAGKELGAIAFDYRKR